MQQPDTKPGLYYVTLLRGARCAWLAGPFQNDHAKALGLVDRCRELAYDVDPRSHWDAFGTARIDLDEPNAPKGVLNDMLEDA